MSDVPSIPPRRIGEWQNWPLPTDVLHAGTSAPTEYNSSESWPLLLMASPGSQGPRSFRLIATEDCYVAQGDSTVTATSSDMLLLAGEEMIVRCTAPANTYVAVIAVSTSGVLTATVLRDNPDTDATLIELPLPDELSAQANLLFHVDASVSSNVVFDPPGTGDGDPITTWLDESGNDNDWVSINGFVTWEENEQNGLGALAFASGGKAQQAPLRSGTQPGEIIAVLISDRPEGVDNGLWTFADVEGSVTPALHPRGSDGRVRHAFGSDAARAINISASVGVDVVRTWHILNISAEPGDWLAYINGTLIRDHGSNTVEWNTNDWHLGRSLGGTVKFFVGRFGEIAMWDKVLSDDERADNVLYLADKWGITL